MTKNNWQFTPGGRKRARAFPLPVEGTPGLQNAITDVLGVHVGYAP